MMRPVQSAFQQTPSQRQGSSTPVRNDRGHSPTWNSFDATAQEMSDSRRESSSGDSVWNFHVWTEGFVSRPDIK